MSDVFVLDTDCQPLDPCHPARARQLLRIGRASVFKRHPFTIILHDRTREDAVVHAYRLKIDPGSKTTGLAIVCGTRVVWAGELTHRGQRITAALEQTPRHQTEQEAAHHPIPATALSQSSPSRRVAPTVSRQPGAQRHHLGGAADTCRANRGTFTRIRTF